MGPPLHYTTRFSLFQNFKVRTKIFRNSFFPCTVNEWNNLDNIIKLSKSYLTFRKRLLNLIRTKCNETYGIHHPTVLNLLILLRLALSHLNDHKFNHNFNQIYSCSLIVENSIHFFLHCHHFSLPKQTLMDNIKSTDKDIINENDSDIVNILLLGRCKYEYHINSKIRIFN